MSSRRFRSENLIAWKLIIHFSVDYSFNHSFDMSLVVVVVIMIIVIIIEWVFKAIGNSKPRYSNNNNKVELYRRENRVMPLWISIPIEFYNGIVWLVVAAFLLVFVCRLQTMLTLSLNFSKKYHRNSQNVDVDNPTVVVWRPSPRNSREYPHIP